MNWDEVICLQCGLINDYTITVKSGQRVCRCNGCDKFLGCKPRESSLSGPEYMPFGKYKGTLISEIDDIDYLEWIVGNTKVKGRLLASLENKMAEIIINE